MTVTPMLPAVGENEVIVGGLEMVKVPLLAVPPGEVMVTGPVVAPLGTVAVICVSLSTENVTALVPLKPTAVVPVKALPLMTTEVPIGPLVGLKEAMFGVPARLTASPT